MRKSGRKIRLADKHGRSMGLETCKAAWQRLVISLVVLDLVFINLD